METPQINQIPELIISHLGQDIVVKNYEIQRLTALGENYGSQIFSLKLHFQDKTTETVAKIPPKGEFVQKMFNIPVTFKNEIDFYTKIVPELEKFVQEKNNQGYLDCFPEFLAARSTLNQDSEEVDDDAVIILENLKPKGYVMVDRTVGFDYATSVVIIKAMAKYHAVPLALKLCKPEVFKAKIRSLFNPYVVFELPNEPIIQKEKKLIESIESCKQYAQRVEDALKRSKTPVVKCSEELTREPFGTVIHTDLWTNNVLVKFEAHEPVDCKIIDFQLGEYGSPLRDILFFMFTSVQIPVLEQHCDELLELYKKCLRDGLLRFGCDVTEFSDEAFAKEIKVVIEQYIFFQCMIMLNPIYDTHAKELDQYSEEDLTEFKEVPVKHKKRAESIVKEFVKRKWI